MELLFAPLDIGGKTLPNRVVRSATWEGLADEEGFVQNELVRLTGQLARFEVGLIIPGYLYIRPDGRGLPRQTGIWSDAHIPGLNRLVSSVHEQGALAVAQIAHAGGRTRRETIGGKTPSAPSSIPEMAFGETPAQLSVSEIHELVKSFAEAARRAREAGFDGVQLHAAHGYLLSQFLSPYYNRRQDAYGGSPADRRRFLIEVFDAVRDATGDGYPILMKINTSDGVEGGISISEALEASRELAARGLCAVETSGGMAGSDQYRPSRTGIQKPSQEAYFRDMARAFKQGGIDIPVILVGGIKSPEVAEDVLQGGDADAVSMSRPFICEPDLVLRWRSGDRNPARCTSCNLCLAEGLKGSGIACVGVSNEQTYQQEERK